VNVPLQPLRVPAGWVMAYNNGLWEIDPDPALVPEDERWVIFKEDMLQMRHTRANRLLDLGFVPEGDLENGQYKLVLYEGDFRGLLIHEFRTRDRVALVAEIERLLLDVFHGKL
jgi:hypothetical protein